MFATTWPDGQCLAHNDPPDYNHYAYVLFLTLSWLTSIEQRNGSKSTIVTSQLPLSKWHDFLSGGNPTVGDAIMDRLVNGAHRIDLAGESSRKRKVEGS